MTDPYKMEAPFVVSFSGGSTSGFMLRKILDAHGGALPAGAEVIFNNTGLEHPKTLDFVNEVQSRWCPVTWLEFCPEKKFRVVSYETASRKGEPFTAMIKWRGYLPTPVARICTVNLKIRCSAAYLLDQGWSQWENAMGLRYDEPHRVHRMKGDRKAETTVCPMYHAKHSLEDVDSFWDNQEFRLGIPRWLGNCCGCFLKSRGRIEMVAEHDPDLFSWWIETERLIGAPFRIDRPSYKSLLQQVTVQGRLFDDDGTTQPCSCCD